MTDSNNTATQEGRDWSKTLNLPQTDYPMRAGLPKKEPELIAKWDEMGLYKRLRENAKGLPKYVLHDGPPYANGTLHIGHALNKILKDMINRSFQMRGFDANYVPGWDCHGLPIEWKIEEQYRAKGKDKNEVPINEFRQECREFADKWIDIQAAEFRRLGIEGDFERPYKTMDFKSESIIAGELLKFAKSGQLYRGSKPIMWSVVERTALAEAEIEYEIIESDTVWVKFPIVTGPDSLIGSSVVIWTTTPWTMPANRCVCYSEKVSYGLFEVTEAEMEFGPQLGDKFIFADSLAKSCSEKAKVTFKRVSDVKADDMKGMILDHPLKGMGVVDGYQFKVPMLQGDHVTDEAGTGFVHTAPGHGRDDFENWIAKRDEIEALGIDSSIPFCVADDGSYTEDAPGFPDVKIYDDKGKKGKANQAVITALIGQNNLFARGRVKHEYPHSWRSKKPIIFRNTPQWFVYMDKEGVLDDAVGPNGTTLRQVSLAAIDETRFVPASGQNRLRAMIEQRPDWVLSRQRAWGVPIAVFRNEETGEVIPSNEFEKSDELISRIKDAFVKEGADAWFADGAKERFLDGLIEDQGPWIQVRDILDVWFDSGSTHAFHLEEREDLKWPADLYLEGTDQHRGWFHSSLLESCGTRGRAPYDAVLTHGFVMSEDGRKMSKSLGNVVTPQEIIKQSGADILRLWVASSDYAEDLRIGPEILKTSVDAYRKLRNTLRWMLGSLAHYDGEEIAFADMPELERLMLHRLAELDEVVQKGYDNFDFKRVFAQLFNFMTVELSAFYFDVRKDALYCEAPSSAKRKASLQVVSILFDYLVKWMAPIMPFTMEETWLMRHPEAVSVHLEQFSKPAPEWKDDALAAKWQKIRRVRRVVTGALEIERREKRIGSSLESAPVVYVNDPDLLNAIKGQDFAEICITSDISIVTDAPSSGSFTLADIKGVGVVHNAAAGKKCARSWRILPEVGTDPDYPELSLRDANAIREIDAA
ncbi:MAG: isoleucine--tRNA ligase [Hyphomicrobiales bacterium]|nr:isoleucine--tRNA ligase [Hyphomicrobiales bacterium]PCH50043.1 MAG: isoleucine--tRNA ligase [Hyphomicrobiales bacterium]PCH50490.1 MAG: isoleucine--tRNA ligase [Hyphomicrobiales bacterium]